MGLAGCLLTSCDGIYLFSAVGRGSIGWRWCGAKDFPPNLKALDFIWALCWKCVGTLIAFLIDVLTVWTDENTAGPKLPGATLWPLSSIFPCPKKKKISNQEIYYLVLINRAGGLYGRILTEVTSTDRMQWGLYQWPRSRFSHTDRPSSVNKMFIIWPNKNNLIRLM